ncbi:MAG: tRNA pseudouridine synthase A [Promethearchaeota archaeon]
MSNSKFVFKYYYIGSQKYYGSQRQNNFMTIEHCILNALRKQGYIHEIDNSQFEFASRTDKHVSARGACFTCLTEKEPILMEINNVLPKEIGVWAYSDVPLEFSSRHSAVLRHYIYIVPFPISYFKKKNGIDMEIMKNACRELEGRHDFANFSKKEVKKRNTIRDMDSVILLTYDDYLIFQIKSKAFLRQQVRRMVKKVLELGLGQISYKDFLELFDTSREISYQPVDPKGLILWDIEYDNKINFTEDPKSKERMNNFFVRKKLYYNHKYHLFRALQQDNFS